MDLSAKKAFELLQIKEIKILDVRTVPEFKSGHIKNAINIDVMPADFRERVAKLDTDFTWLVYCRSGSRSRNAVQVMQELGFENILHLKHGLLEWESEGLPLEY